MSNLIQLYFHLKIPKNHTSGPIPIYARISVKGKRIEISLNRKREAEKWCRKSERVSGNREAVRNLNKFIEQFQIKVYDSQVFLQRNSEEVSIEAIRDHILGKKESVKTILEVFENHNKKVEALVGKEFTEGTLERYKTSLKHTRDFINWKYKVSDLDIRKIDHEFVTEYEFYLWTVRNCANNSAVKYIKNFGKIVRICLSNGWIKVNPMVNYKARVKKVDRVFLSAEELEVLATKEFSIERIAQVRDIFLFSCYTGLAYVDVKKLRASEILKGIDGELWIFTKQQKTDIASRIPLLLPA